MTKEIYILGNGPSLRGFDFHKLTGQDCVGMNVAYRYWHRINWYPKYYTCLDTVMLEQHHEAIRNLALNYSDRITLFFLRKNILKFCPDLKDKTQVLFLEDYIGTPFFGDGKMVTTGSYACLFAAMMGYLQMYLLGIDLNQVEQIPEAKPVGGNVLEITDTPKHNPNYFFDDYQQTGEKFNIPNTKPNLHYESWVAVKERLDKFGVTAINCNPASNLDLFMYDESKIKTPSKSEMKTTGKLISPRIYPEQSEFPIVFMSGILDKYKLDYFNDLGNNLFNHNYRLIWLNEGEPSLSKESIDFEVINLNEYMKDYCAEDISYYFNIDDFELKDEALKLKSDKENRDVSEVKKELNKYLKCIQILFAKYDVKLCILWHQFKCEHLLLSAFCKKESIPYLFTEFGCLPGTLSWDAQGQMAESPICIDTKTFNELPIDISDIQNTLFLLKLLKEKKVRRKKVPTEVHSVKNFYNSAKGRKIIFYAGQNDFNAGLYPPGFPRQEYQSPIYKSSYDALIHLSKLAEKNDWQIWFKPHPLIANKPVPPEVKEKLNFQNVKILYHADFFECIAYCDVATTILSQSAYMFLIYEKPTVLLGRMQLSGKKCVWEPKNYDDVEQALTSALRHGFTRQQYINFVHHTARLCRYHLFPLKSNATEALQDNSIKVETQISALIPGRDTEVLAENLIKHSTSDTYSNGFPFPTDQCARLSRADKNKSGFNAKQSIVFYVQNSAVRFSGGRYHAWLMAEACAELGWDVSVITNNEPSFYNDLNDENLFPHHKDIKLHIQPITKEICELPKIPCDVFVFVPHSDCHGVFVNNALNFADKNAKRTILINFETPNWFNKLSPEKREETKWTGWKEVAQKSSLVLSSAAESNKFAKEYYSEVEDKSVFDFCFAPVNTRIADSIPKLNKEKRIVVFLRPNAAHKGEDFINSILCESMKGYTLVIIIPTHFVDNDYIDALVSEALKYKVKVELLKCISETTKWIELKRASLLLFPSYFEGFGLPPVEAQYCGTPCIAFDLPVLREVNGEGIVYVNPGDVKSMQQKIKDILSADIDWSHLTENIQNRLDFSAYVISIHRLLNSLLQRERENLTYHKNRNQFLHGISTCTYDQDSMSLHIKGWALPRIYDTVQVHNENDEFLGTAKTKQKRIDIYKKHPYYEERRAGWVFDSGIDKDKLTYKIFILYFKDGEIIYRKESRIKKSNSEDRVHFSSSSAKIQKKVAYFPHFKNFEELNNHYHRACWYLPKVDGLLDEVLIGADKNVRPGQRPSYMCQTRQNTDHIKIEYNMDIYSDELKSSDLLLVWRKLTFDEQNKLKSLNKSCLYIDTHDTSCLEYGVYCKVHWELTSKDQRNNLLNNSFAKFKKLAGVYDRQFNCGVVFGTGPSIERAFEFDFSNCFTHACNSIVGSKELLNHIKPNLISAGDAVSHFGVSKYAEAFREDLCSVLKNTDCHFLTTAKFGNLFRLQYPELDDKILLCDQRGKHPNYNLLEQWSLPALDSVLNIHMLPVAATLFDHIFINGADGKNPDPNKNEDFWGHSKIAQYHDLVETGHLAHPTFDINRQKSTHDRYLFSVKQTLEAGEQLGKKYYTITPSFTPGLKDRFIEKSRLEQFKIGPRPRYIGISCHSS